MKTPSTVSRETWACMTKKEKAAAQPRKVTLLEAKNKIAPLLYERRISSTDVLGAPEHLVKRLYGELK